MNDDVTREPSLDTAESKTPRMRGNFMRENRETQATPSPDGGEGRSGKAVSHTPDMYEAWESDDSIVPAKRANKTGARPTGRAPVAESVEERESTKGKARRPTACRTQCRRNVLNGSHRIRDAASATDRFTQGRSRMR